jgi:hypothetical protein
MPLIFLSGQTNLSAVQPPQQHLSAAGEAPSQQTILPPQEQNDETVRKMLNLTYGAVLKYFFLDTLPIAATDLCSVR